MQAPIAISPEHTLTLLRSAVREFQFKAGDIIKAEVLNLTDSGTASLRLIRENGPNVIVVARTDVPLSKGTTAFFKVSAADNEIKLQFMGNALEKNPGAENAVDNALSQKIMEVLSELSDSKLRSADLNTIKDLFRNIPEGLKSAYPEFGALERLLPEIERLNAGLLKASVEGSGLLFETRLKIAARESLQGNKESLSRLLSDPDQKGLLLKIRGLLKNDDFVAALKSSGLKTGDIADAVDKLVKNIEYFQLTSKANDMLYAFLPFSWQELRDGELSFRKQEDHCAGRSYTCDINVDLEPAGKIGVSVTMFDGAFYISFRAEKQETTLLILSRKGDLEIGFVEKGMPLRAINIGEKGEIKFGATKQHGLNLKV